MGLLLLLACLALVGPGAVHAESPPERATDAPEQRRAAIASSTPAANAGPRGAAADAPAERLRDGAPSIDALLDRFLAALAANDAEALESLRVTGDEYRRIVVPGSVEPGKPPQILSAEGLEYFWDEMSQKSAAHRSAILARFGGRPLTRVRHSFEKGERQFAGYKAYEKLALVLRSEKGEEVELRTGSIIERDGVFKFASFIRD